MNTEIITVSQNDSDLNEKLACAAACIKGGGLVVFPTETVYGLGGNALRADAAERIYKAKGRPSDNPLIIHIANAQDAKKYCHTNELFDRLAEIFWPGPLTMIAKKRDCIPSAVTGGMDTVAVRLPSDPIARTLIALSGVPIAAPSANLSGHPSPTTKAHVINDLLGRVDMIIAGEDARIGVESTVIKVDENDVTVLRPGGVTYEDLCAIVGREHVKIDRVVTEKIEEGVAPLSPGMKYRHYAPIAPVHLLSGTEEAITAFLRRAAKEDDAAFLVYDEDAYLLPPSRTKTLGRKNVPNEQAHKLFDCLRAFDEMKGISRIYARLPEKAGIGLAVYNRLAKAAGFTVIDVESGEVGELK